MMSDLDGKVAVVTGGSRGIGAAICRALAARGASVTVNYRVSESAAHAIAAEITAAGGKALPVRADVLDPTDVSRLLEKTVEAFGHLDVVVSNAAISFSPTSFTAIEWDDFIAKVDDELKAAFLVTKRALPLLLGRPAARLIYISSETAKTPGSIGNVAHGVAKAALDSFVRFLALEFAGEGITANAVSSGLVRTDATSAVPEAYLRQVESLVPLGRLGQPDDIATVVAFLASDDSRFITGSSIGVLGGQGLGRGSKADADAAASTHRP